jgi:phospholipid-binding lipoprotein MlaA
MILTSHSEHQKNRFRYVPLFAGVLLLGGCAATKGADDVNDPFETVNRAIFDFNLELDRAILRPAARTYADNVPERIRRMVHAAINFIRTPIILANDILQGDVDRAGITMARTMTNLVLGFGGTVDAASEMGVEFHDEDFGQTLAIWGAEEGPYLVLPLLGPSNPRDAIGTGVDSFGDPMNFFAEEAAVSLPRTGASAVDARSRNLDTLEDLERTSLDFYAAVRSLYRQRRKDEIKNGESQDPVPIPAISFEGQTAPATHAKGRDDSKPTVSFEEGVDKPRADKSRDLVPTGTGDGTKPDTERAKKPAGEKPNISLENEQKVPATSTGDKPA